MCVAASSEHVEVMHMAKCIDECGAAMQFRYYALMQHPCSKAMNTTLAMCEANRRHAFVFGLGVFSRGATRRLHPAFMTQPMNTNGVPIVDTILSPHHACVSGAVIPDP